MHRESCLKAIWHRPEAEDQGVSLTFYFSEARASAADLSHPFASRFPSTEGLTPNKLRRPPAEGPSLQTRAGAVVATPSAVQAAAATSSAAGAAAEKIPTKTVAYDATRTATTTAHPPAASKCFHCYSSSTAAASTNNFSSGNKKLILQPR